MKTRTKVALAVLCALLLVTVSILGTLAYLTSTDSVTNTFTVGKVAITLDEADVDEYGKLIENAPRVQENEYKLIPGHTYTKDPTVHVDAASEDAYIFVEIADGIADLQAATTVTDQITGTYGWTALNGVPNVYYKQYTKDQADTDLKVFETFTINSSAEADDLNSVTTATKLSVTAYAIQKDGLNDASAAWNALAAQMNA